MEFPKELSFHSFLFRSFQQLRKQLSAYVLRSMKLAPGPSIFILLTNWDFAGFSPIFTIINQFQYINNILINSINHNKAAGFSLKQEDFKWKRTGPQNHGRKKTIKPWVWVKRSDRGIHMWGQFPDLVANVLIIPVTLFCVSLSPPNIPLTFVSKSNVCPLHVRCCCWVLCSFSPIQRYLVLVFIA